MRPAIATAIATEVDDLQVRLGSLGATVAIGLPALLAYNLPPSATFFNQALALFGWGAWLVLLTAALPVRASARASGLNALLLALALLCMAALGSTQWANQPLALSLSAAGLIAAAALTAIVAAGLQQAGLGVPAFRAFCVGLLVASVASSVIGLVQVYVPQWADGDWIARSSVAGRAVGNLRQPNHLCTLLMWGLVAAVWFVEQGVVRRRVGAGAALLLIFALVLSASRSGLVGALMLAAWGLLDRRLSGRTRVALLLAPAVYGLMWLGATAWAHYSQLAFAGESRFSGQGDISSSRFGIWANTLDLIRANPWWGVGFGEFNFAWTLTPFPGRSVHFFDHAHNLPLHLASELGLPLAGLVVALLGWSLWCAWKAAFAPARARPAPAGRAGRLDHTPLAGADRLHLRAAFVMVSMVLVHSLLEYPLWYAYFLLPAAFALGLGLGAGGGAGAGAGAGADEAVGDAGVRSGAVSPAAGPSGGARSAVARPANAGSSATRPLLVAAMLMMLGAVVSVRDYMRVVVIFTPSANATPLEQRIDEGQRSWFFSHHGDYAAVTTAVNAEQAARGWAGAPHYLLDARLMQAWATALHEAGDEQRARHVAKRLKEFRNKQAEAFFAPCTEPAVAGQPRPFQCLAPEVTLGYRDFR